MNRTHTDANVMRRHAKHWRGTNGYFLVCGIRDGLFALSLTGLMVILGGPVIYGLGLA